MHNFVQSFPGRLFIPTSDPLRKPSSRLRPFTPGSHFLSDVTSAAPAALLGGPMAVADTASQWAGASHAAGARRSHRWVLEPEAARDRALWTEGPSRGGAAAESAARVTHSSARASAAAPRELLRTEGGLASRRSRTHRSPQPVSRRRLPARAARPGKRGRGLHGQRPRPAAVPPRSRVALEAG